MAIVGVVLAVLQKPLAEYNRTKARDTMAIVDKGHEDYPLFRTWVI